MASSKKKKKKKVCVVGAGVSGLASARELRREGHDVTVMEQSAGVGGQWLYDPATDGGDTLSTAGAHSSIYASLRLNTGVVTGRSRAAWLLPRTSSRFPNQRERPRPAVHYRWSVDSCRSKVCVGCFSLPQSSFRLQLFSKLIFHFPSQASVVKLYTVTSYF
ncbi:unnamed protein product [Urochloa humidicola]